MTAPRRPSPGGAQEEGVCVTDVIVVGAGLAGLCCARELAAHGDDVLVLERGDDVGGRVRTDVQDGFLLDRGFQVLLTAYPEAQRTLDYESLRLRPFLSGALVRRHGRFLPLADPLRRPGATLQTLREGPGTVADKLRVARLRVRLGRASLNELLQAPQTTTAEALRREGFSAAFVEAFWRPFLSGVFLDPELDTSSRQFSFVVKLFAAGDAALPAAGMQAIPRQLAAGLPAGAVRTHATVEALEQGGVRLAGGESLAAATVVVATEAPEAARLTGAFAAPAARAATTLYFAAERTPWASRCSCWTARRAARSTICACPATWRQATAHPAPPWSRPRCWAYPAWTTTPCKGRCASSSASGSEVRCRAGGCCACSASPGHCPPSPRPCSTPPNARCACATGCWCAATIGTPPASRAPCFPAVAPPRRRGAWTSRPPARRPSAPDAPRPAQALPSSTLRHITASTVDVIST